MVGIVVFELWMFGGNSNTGANCGLAYANSNNVWSNSNSNYSARLTTLHSSRNKAAAKNIRVSVLRHGNAPEYHEPRQRARMYSTCWSEQHSPCAESVSALPPVTLVNPLQSGS